MSFVYSIFFSDEMHTVLWLAEEAASHFYQLYGLKPLLSLSLQDGTKLQPNSLVSSFFLNCTEVCFLYFVILNIVSFFLLTLDIE